MTMPRDEHGFIKVACPTCGEQLFGVQEWSAGDPIAEAMTAELRALREENERLRGADLVTAAVETSLAAAEEERDTARRESDYWQDHAIKHRAERDTARADAEKLREENERLKAERDDANEAARELHDLVCCAEYATGSAHHDGECPTLTLIDERDTARRERDEAREALREACDHLERDKQRTYANDLRKRGGIAGTEGSGT